MGLNNSSTNDTAVDAIDSQIETLSNTDSIGKTVFSKLFHDARTTSRRRATCVSLQVRVSDGEFECHKNPVKTRQGEHLRGTDAWDYIVSIPVKPFMETQTAKSEIIRQLRDMKRHATSMKM